MSAPERPPLRRIASDLRPHRRLAARSAAVIVGSTLCGLAAPAIFASAIDRGVIGRDPGWVVVCAIGFAAVALAQTTCMSLEVLWMGRLAQDYLFDLRGRLVRQLFHMDLDFFGRERSGRLVSRLTSDVENLQQFFEGGLGLLLRAGLVLLLTAVVLVSQSVKLSIAVFIVLLPLVGASIWYRSRAFAAQVTVRDRVAGLMSHLNESLVGMRVVQAFGVEQDQREEFDRVNTDTYAARMRSARVTCTYYPIVELLHPVALAAVIGYGALLVSRGEVRVGTVVAFTLYLGRLFEPIQQLTELSHIVQTAAASYAKVFAFRDERPHVFDAPDAKALEPGAGEIVIDHASFRYAPTTPTVLHDVSLRIAPGERVALVGGSGAGKSSLVKLLARFYDPSSGTVHVDGQDLRTVTGSSLRRHLALVPQEGFLFDGTIAANIALARPGASEADVEAACRELGVLERLEALPDGLQTEVANRGLTLSSGQRQLVALARAFLAQPRILVLDEATSNLDPATEATVETALRTLFEGRTAVVIAHRVSSALRSDRVILMAKGRVVEDGSPAELLAAGGHFAAWVASAPESAAAVATLKS